MATYVNDLRLKEIGTGESSGTWGTETNVNLELIGEAMGYATKAVANASTSTITMPDGTATGGELRSLYLKLTGGGQASTVTLAPNTVSKVWFIENATSYTLTFTMGSGANVAVLAGQTKSIASDGAGSGAALYDVMTDLSVAGDFFVANTIQPAGDTASGDNAAFGYASADGAILTGQGSTSDVTLKNDADGTVLTIPTGTTNVDIVGTATAATFEPDGDTAAGDNAAIGYTSAEGLILTGQGSTNDVTIKNDADADVIEIPTGTTTVNFAGAVDVVGDLTAATFTPDGDTASGDAAAIGFTAAEGLILTGQGSTNDVTIKNDADTDVIEIPTGTVKAVIAGLVEISAGDIAIKNSGTVSTVKFYCESNNAHYAQLQAPAHSAFSGNVTLVLPATSDTLAGIAATQTLSNKTLAHPLISGDTAAGDDAALGYTSAEGLILTGQGSTNDVTIKNDADAAVLTIPTGTVNVAMAGTVTATSTIVGNAGIHAKNGATGAGFVQFFEDSDNGTNKVTLAGPASTADITLTLPSSAGVNGQALVTNGSGVLSFEAVGGGNVVDFVASGTLPNGKPVVLKSNGTIEVVASGGSSTVISAGSPTVFESADSEWNSVTRLTDTTAIVTYRDNGNSGYGTACILTVSGSSITSGTPVVFESASTYYISVIRLTDTKALVAYQDRGNSSYGTSVILTISGTSISVGTPVVFESASTEYISADMLTATKAIVVYRDASPTYGTACILTVSGTSITAVTPVVFESASVYYPSVTALSDTKAIVAYYDAANAQNRPFTAAVLTVSGTSISVGTPANVTTTSGIGAHIAITALSTTKALIAYQDNGNSGYGTAVVVTVSGTSISAGTPLVLRSADVEYSSAATLTATKAMVVYRDNGNSNYGTSVILDVDNTSITKGTAVVFEAAVSRFISLTALTQYKALVAYEDSANSKYGTSVILDNVVNTNLTSTNFVGMSTAAYTNGQTATVAVLGGISSNQTSLTIAATYYVQIDGTLSTVAGNPSVVAGKAVSATTLILKGL